MLKSKDGHSHTLRSMSTMSTMSTVSPERIAEIYLARDLVKMREEDLQRATRIFVAAAEAVAEVPARKGARQNSTRRRKSEASKRGRALAKAWTDWEVKEALERVARAELRILGVTFHDDPDVE